jgi:hypothetical protein
MTWLTVTESMSQMTSDILVVEMKSYSFFSFVVYCQIFGMINMKCAEGLVRNEVATLYQ